MKTLKIISSLLLPALLLCGCSSVGETQNAAPRKVAVQSYSYRLFTVEDALKNAKTAGADSIEIYPNQQLAKSMPNAKFGKNLTSDERAALKKMISESGVKLVSMGVFGGRGLDEKFIRQTCEFAKDMGVNRVLIESPVSTFPFWKKYAAENGITICIHHHSTSSANLYADPDVMDMLTNEYGFKVCADIGHWEASGIDPVAALKKLEGKIGELHIKDKRTFKGDAKSKCVPFGEGVVDMKGVLKELDRQGFDGFFVIEYEAEWDNNTPSIAKCVQYLRKN